MASRKVIGKLDSTLLADQARMALLEAILDGRFAERLPNEETLAEMLDVSRTTVRAALGVLEQEGVVTRRRALGTTINRHVSPSTLALQRLVNIDLFVLLEKQGHDVDQEVDWRREPAPASFVETFAMDPATECISMQKTYRVDGVVVMHTRSVVPVEELRDEDIKDPLPALIPEFSDRYCRAPITHSVARITACAFATVDTRLPPNDDAGAFTRLLETMYSAEATVVGRGILDVDDRFLQLEIFRRR